MDQRLPLPLPAPSEPNSSLEARRLWIGNLDKRVTETLTKPLIHVINCLPCLFFYWLQLVKLLQNYGPIENFDLLYHKTGPDAGLPRGYAFVTFRDEESALKLKNSLDGKKLGLRNLSIQWAHNAEKDNEMTGKRNLAIPALGVGVTAKKDTKPESISSKIQAIESKLKMMSQLPEEEFSLTTPRPSSSETIAATDNKVINKPTRRFAHPSVQNRHRFKPYHKH